MSERVRAGSSKSGLPHDRAVSKLIKTESDCVYNDSHSNDDEGCDMKVKVRIYSKNWQYVLPKLCLCFCLSVCETKHKHYLV